MPSPTAALLWAIWRRHSASVWAIAGLTVLGRVIYTFEGRGDSPLIDLLGLLSFLLLFGVFNYTDSNEGRGRERFPSGLFTLPVSSMQLVATPVIAGIASIELLYLAWKDPLSQGGSTGAPFIGVLLAALMMTYQTVLWTLERFGAMRLVLLGVIATILFGIGLLPSFPPAPPPWWRSEPALAAVMLVATVGLFLVAWNHVARLRHGGTAGARPLQSLVERIAGAWPRRRRGFRSELAAQFWFEWRCSGLVLPALVAGVLLMVVAPLSWLWRNDAGDTFSLLLGTLAIPIVLAVPVGIAFSRPTMWSDDLELPAFVAVRPVSADDLIAVKVRVAAATAALSWLLLITFVMVWLSSWANLDAVSRLAMQVWAFHGRSMFAVYGFAVLAIAAGALLTWRFLVVRLWSGLAGGRMLFATSAGFVAVLTVAAMVFDVSRLPAWLFAEPARLAAMVWLAAALVIAKYWFAAYAWRGAAPPYLAQYVAVWLVGTTFVMALGVAVWGIARIYVPMDTYRVHSLVVLLALLAVPLGRVGIAPSRLARNRHR